MDTKTIILLASLFLGSNAITGVGSNKITGAASGAEIDKQTAATNELLVMYQSQTDQLATCHEKLRECYKECSGSAHIHAEDSE